MTKEIESIKNLGHVAKRRKDGLLVTSTGYPLHYNPQTQEYSFINSDGIRYKLLPNGKLLPINRTKKVTLVKKNNKYFLNGNELSNGYIALFNSPSLSFGIDTAGTYIYKDGKWILQSKPDPDYVMKLWDIENPKRWKTGMRTGEKVDEKGDTLYYSYKDTAGSYIGPGFDYALHGSPEFKKKVLDGIGVTREEIDSEVSRHMNNSIIPDLNTLLRKYTSFPDTISPLIKQGLFDIYWQSGKGGFRNWSRNQRLLIGVADGNLPMIRENGISLVEGKPDKRRNDLRNEEYWYYK